MTEHTSLLFPHWGQIAIEQTMEQASKILELKAENERLHAKILELESIIEGMSWRD